MTQNKHYSKPRTSSSSDSMKSCFSCSADMMSSSLKRSLSSLSYCSSSCVSNSSWCVVSSFQRMSSSVPSIAFDMQQRLNYLTMICGSNAFQQSTIHSVKVTKSGARWHPDFVYVLSSCCIHSPRFAISMDFMRRLTSTSSGCMMEVMSLGIIAISIGGGKRFGGIEMHQTLTVCGHFWFHHQRDFLTQYQSRHA